MNYQFYLASNSLIENFCTMKRLYQYEVKETEEYKIMLLYPMMNDEKEQEYFICIDYKNEDITPRYDILQYFGDIELKYNPIIRKNFFTNLVSLEKDIMECVEDYLKTK